MNEEIGFKCLHYSVTEGSGTVKVVAFNAKDTAVTVGIKTVSDTALENDDFKPIDQEIIIPANGTQQVEVEIINDEGWEPDEDFFLILYAAGDAAKKQLRGDNCKTKVTILDDDKPGILQFKETLIKAKKSQGSV